MTVVDSRPAAPKVYGDIRPPQLPRTVWVDGWPTPVAHRWAGGGMTACWLPTVGTPGGDGMPVDAVRRLGGRITWCTDTRCWGTGRCRYCRVPSGVGDECADCLHASISADKALGRADG